jgi:D-sedoheptulose 7-phosphate isomerase
LKEKILYSIEESVRAVEQLGSEVNLTFIDNLAHMIAECLCDNKKVLIAGNGGSLCDAMHFAEELTGFFRKKRRALAAIALADVAHMSCVGNDLGYEHVFARAIEAYGQEGDVFIALSTSGNSTNLVLACKRAKELGLKTAALLGRGGGSTRGICDLELIIKGCTTSDRVQEAHMAALHICIEMVEEHIFWSGDLVKEQKDQMALVDG